MDTFFHKRYRSGTFSFFSEKSLTCPMTTPFLIGLEPRVLLVVVICQNALELFLTELYKSYCRMEIEAILLLL